MCTGILDEQGVCGYCGRKYSLPPGVTPIVVDDALPPGDAALHDGIEPESDASDSIALADELEILPTELSDRVPCGDELCTGILDEQGVCGYCGKSFPDLLGR